MKKQTKESMLYMPGKVPVVITPQASQFTVKELHQYLDDNPTIIEENSKGMVMIVGTRGIRTQNHIRDILKNTEVKIETNLIICQYSLVADIFQ